MTNQACVGDAMPDAQDIEKRRAGDRVPRGAAGVRRKGEIIGLITMRGCDGKRADKDGPNPCKLVMQSLQDRHREEGEQETKIKRSGDGSPSKWSVIRVDLHS